MRVKDLTKQYDGKTVVDSVSFEISVFITVGGGIYFLYLLLSNRRV